MILGGLLRPPLRNGITHLGAGRYGLGGALETDTNIRLAGYTLTFTDGKVGIGTNMPTERLHVQTGGGAFLVDDLGFVTFPSANSTGSSGIRTPVGISLGLWIGGSRVGFISSSGTGSATISRPSFGIGNSANTGDPSVFYSSDPTNLVLRGGSGTPTSPGNILFRTRDDLTRGLITNDGRWGIGTTSPHASAIVEISSTSQGFLPPRMTTAQRLSIVNPATGLIVFGLTEDELYIKKSSGWKIIQCI